MAGYAVILRRSAMVTAVSALIMVVLSAALGGVKGLVGALLGVGLVIVFFGISAAAMSWASRRNRRAERPRRCLTRRKSEPRASP